MKRVAILTQTVISGDAVSNDVLGMHDILQAQGLDVRLFASDWKVSGPKICNVKELASFKVRKTDILIYHFSIGWDLGLKIFINAKCKKVIKYHNITPPTFFDQINSEYANACRSGRNELTKIANAKLDMCLADSEYNMSEFIEEGCEKDKCFVVPPFHHIDRLNTIEADPRLLDYYRDGAINILMVGRIAPNKGHEKLINAFASYYHNYNTNSRLIIVGKKDVLLSLYTKNLEELIYGLGIQNSVVFSGGVSDESLKAYYLLADIFLITSDHEGFCVPLVEAMAMKVPVIALGTSAIPGTVRKAGIVWETYDPLLFAGSIDYVVNNKSAMLALKDKGRERYLTHFTNECIEIQFLSAIRGLL